MKIQIKRKNSATLPGTINAGEPILAVTSVESGGQTTNHDTMFIGSIDGNSWKKVSMASFTPSYSEIANSTINASIGMYNFWFGTQAAYDAITTKDSNTFYFITE